MNHGQIQINKTHHSLYLWEGTTFPLIVFSSLAMGGLHPNVILSRDSQVGSTEIPKIGTLKTLEAHNFL
jgi:hypothetical protein